MSFTAHEYRTAARVFHEEYGDEDQVLLSTATATSWLEGKAEKLEARERYAEMLAGIRIPGAAPIYNGARLLDRLLSDGWTPPEGLF